MGAIKKCKQSRKTLKTKKIIAAAVLTLGLKIICA